MPRKVIADSDCVLQLKDLVAAEYVPDSPTHDLSHLARVASLADKICQREGGDRLVAVCAAWLHDLHRDVGQSNELFFVPPENTDDRVRTYLAKASVPETIYEDILEAIHYTDRFSFSDRPTYQTTFEAMAVRDADCLDAIGAIGIARAFSFGGAHNIALWREGLVEQPSSFNQSERPSSTIQHFYDKLLRLSGEFETLTGKALAHGRSVYMEEFVRQFMAEWREDGGV